MAARAGAWELVEWLAGRGAATEARAVDGRSALMLAVEGRAWQAVETLVEAGARVEASDREGSTPLLIVRAKNISPVGCPQPFIFCLLCPG